MLFFIVAPVLNIVQNICSPCPVERRRNSGRGMGWLVLACLSPCHLVWHTDGMSAQGSPPLQHVPREPVSAQRPHMPWWGWYVG